VSLVSEHNFQELALCFELRFLVGLRIQLHGRSDVFVTENALYRFRITLQKPADNAELLEVIRATLPRAASGTTLPS
jgi:hypothetical protein